MLRRITGATAWPALVWAVLAAVCLAPLRAADDGSAIVIQLAGRVSWLKDNVEPWALNLNDKVQVGRTIVTGPDGYAMFRVSDGSTFEVFANSQIVFRPSRSNWTQILEMMIGHVKVHIQHLLDRPNPNQVHTPTAVISVRGTVFDVDVKDDDGTTFVTVDEGVVDVENRTAPGPVKTLHRDESVTVYRNIPLAKLTDRGGAARVALRIATQAAYEAIYRGSPRVGGSTGTTGTPLPGDKKPAPAPPAPPAPPPPPPPPPGPGFLPNGLMIPASLGLRGVSPSTVALFWLAASTAF